MLGIYSLAGGALPYIDLIDQLRKIYLHTNNEGHYNFSVPCSVNYLSAYTVGQTQLLF